MFVLVNPEGHYWSTENKWTPFLDCAKRYTAEERECFGIGPTDRWMYVAG